MKKYLHSGFNLADIVDYYDELPLWSAPFGLNLLEKVKYKTNLTALDIGFGAGFPLTELALRLGESSLVYGIDPWTDAIKRAEKKITHYGITNIRIIEGVAESIPLANASVDLVVSNNGINNVSNIDTVFTECARIMKPGGQFVLTMNLDKSMFEFYSIFESVLSELHLEKEIAKMKQHIYEKRRPLDEIISMLHNHEFIIRELDHDQFNYLFADGTALLNHYFIRLAFMDAWIKLLPGESVGNVFTITEERLNEESALLGGIRLSIPFVTIDAVRKQQAEGNI
jgi:ubiquinone/menaquinone biosynthesis C-methylase UbiE